jgi:hypothetical protein
MDNEYSDLEARFAEIRRSLRYRLCVYLVRLVGLVALCFVAIFLLTISQVVGHEIGFTVAPFLIFTLMIVVLVGAPLTLSLGMMLDPYLKGFGRESVKRRQRLAKELAKDVFGLRRPGRRQ